MQVQIYLGETMQFPLPRCENGFTWDTMLTADDYRIINLSVFHLSKTEISVFGKSPGRVFLWEVNKDGTKGRKIVIIVREIPKSGKQLSEETIANDDFEKQEIAA